MEKETYRFDVTEEDKGKRLDKFLVEKLSEKFSRSFIQKLVHKSGILLGGLPVKSHHKINAGDSIEVVVPEPVESVMKKEDIPLDIVYEDESVLVVNKSGDMVVHPAPGNYSGTLVNALLYKCKNLSGIGGVLKPGIVHRIDKGTSGLLVVAKTDHAHRELAKQFKAKSAKRVYVALVEGIVQLDNGVIELPIARSKRDRKKMAVDLPPHQLRPSVNRTSWCGGKDALTRYKVLKRFKDSTLLELVLGTGRTHQIRVHMSYMGHPLLGDNKYGARHGLPRPMLHAKTIGFVHPASKKYMEFTSEPPPDMKALISGMES